MRQQYVICVKKFKMSDRDCPDLAYHKVYTLLLTQLIFGANSMLYCV